MTRPRKKHPESGLKLTRAQRRQIEKLDAHVDEVSASDRRWFERHPERRHRIRVSHPCEIAQNEILDDKAWTPPPRWKWFTVVRNVASGLRTRLYTTFYDEAPTDVDEATARMVFEHLETEHGRKFEANILRAMGGRR